MLITLSVVPRLVDVLVELAAHGAQLLADSHLLVEEALDLLLLLGAHQRELLSLRPAWSSPSLRSVSR